MIKKMMIDGQIEEVVIPVETFQLGKPAEEEYASHVDCRKFVNECANYDQTCDWCWERDRKCFQATRPKCCCEYFKDCVLPGIEAEKTKVRRVICKDCKKLFEKPLRSRTVYCPECRKARKREQTAACVRRKRGK